MPAGEEGGGLGGCKEEGDRHFSGVPTDSARGTGHKLKHMKFHLNTGKRFFLVRVVKH